MIDKAHCVKLQAFCIKFSLYSSSMSSETGRFESDSFEKKQTGAPSDLSTAEKSLCVSRIDL